MSDETQSTTASSQKFRLNGLYIKDISFENPSAPEIFLSPGGKPGIDIKFDIALKPLGNTNYEVALKLTTTATENTKALFLIEVAYAGLFIINPDLPPAEHDKLLLTECAAVIFPFARRVIADLVQEGGFPPLLLEPINFEAIFNSRQK